MSSFPQGNNQFNFFGRRFQGDPLADFARQNGGQFRADGNFVLPGGARGNGVAGRVGGSIPRTFGPQAQAALRRRMGPNFLSQMAAGLVHDINRQQGAADRQFERNNEQIAAFEELVGRAPDQLRDLADEQSGTFNQIADDLRQQGVDSLDAFEQGASETLGDVRGQVDLANQFASDSVSTQQAAVEGFADRTATDARNAAIGIRENSNRQRKQIEAGVNPDGSLMTPAEQQAALSQLNQNTEVQVTQAIGAINSDFNRTQAQLRGQLAAVQQGAAQTALGGANALGSVGASLSGQRAQVLQGNQQNAQFAASMQQFGEQLRSAANLEAVNFEAQGRQAIAQLVQQNPEGIVSIFAGLSSLFGAATAPGASRLGAVDFDSLVA